MLKKIGKWYLYTLGAFIVIAVIAGLTGYKDPDAQFKRALKSQNIELMEKISHDNPDLMIEGKKATDILQPLEKAKAEQIAKEKAEKLAKERAESERIAKEKAEKIAKEKAEKLTKKKAKKEQLAKEKAKKSAKRKPLTLKQKANNFIRSDDSYLDTNHMDLSKSTFIDGTRMESGKWNVRNVVYMAYLMDENKHVPALLVQTNTSETRYLLFKPTNAVIKYPTLLKKGVKTCTIPTACVMPLKSDIYEVSLVFNDKYVKIEGNSEQGTWSRGDNSISMLFDSKKHGEKFVKDLNKLLSMVNK